MPYSGQTIKPLVSMSDEPNGCWEWLGKISKSTGYGQKTLNGKTLLAHRWIWITLFGPIPENLVINHKCSNRRCVNPLHLEVTDQAGNCRHGKGTKLTAKEVQEIKKAKLGKKFGDGKKLAEKYNVSGSHIHDIWNNRTWTDIQP